MAESVVSVFNLACSAIGTRARIASPTEATREAEVCLDWYEIVRDRVLQMAPWPEARASARLALNAERDDALDWEAADPSPGFFFSYNLPSDHLHPRFLTGHTKFDVALGADNRMQIQTQIENAILVYTKRQEDPTVWGPQLSLAIIYSLGAFIAMPLHAKSGRASAMLTQANQLVADARITAANMGDWTLDSMPPWLAARGYSDMTSESRFYYPPMPMWGINDLPPVIR